jgi:hypothetical protein
MVSQNPATTTAAQSGTRGLNGLAALQGAEVGTRRGQGSATASASFSHAQVSIL